MSILIYLSIFWLGVFVGIFIHSWFISRFRYSGTLIVSTDRARAKTVYSLVLDEYPEKLQFEKAVMFKVDTSDQSSDRD